MDDAAAGGTDSQQILQSYRGKKVPPAEIHNDLVRQTQSGKARVWYPRFRPLLRPLKAGEPTMAWVQCGDCNALLLPSNLSRLVKHHRCTRSAVPVPPRGGAASGAGPSSSAIASAAVAGSGAYGGGSAYPDGNTDSQQRSITGFVATASQQREFLENLFMYSCTTETPLSRIENPWLVAAAAASH